MRQRSREIKAAFGGRPDGVENMLDIWADQLEAAAKLDAEMWKCAAYQFAQSMIRRNMDALERACVEVLDAESLKAVIAAKKRIQAQAEGGAA